jgi:hypothetical protein
MLAMTEPTCSAEEWSPEIDLILSALEAGRNRPGDRRAEPRQTYRTAALLRLFSDGQDTPPWTLFTRDLDARGIGFITRHRLPLGYGGVVRLTLPNGEEMEANCTLLRCRQAVPGWFEGSLYFNRTQHFQL